MAFHHLDFPKTTGVPLPGKLQSNPLVDPPLALERAGRKEWEMLLPARFRAPAVASLVGGAALVGILAGSSAARTDSAAAPSVASAAAHRCLVATGSGDPAFVRNFNP